jgi:DNA-binding response OmpR family regulator
MSYVDALRLSHLERLRLLEQLRKKQEESPNRQQRGYERIPLESGPAVVMELYHPQAREPTYYLLRPHNISRGGVGFLHGHYLYPGSRCILHMQSLGEQRCVIPGRIAWCSHVRRHIHEAGVAFDELIDIEDFIDNSLQADAKQQASEELPHLEGRVLYADPNEDDQALVQFYLQKLGAEVRLAGDGAEAYAALQGETFQLLVARWDLPTLSGPQLREQAAECYSGPLLLVPPPDDSQAQAQIADIPNAASLCKPYSLQRLIEAVQPHLAREAAPAPNPVPRILVSAYSADPAMRPLIQQFVHRLQKRLEQMNNLLSQSDINACREAARELQGSAASYGYPDIADAADRLCDKLHQQDLPGAEQTVERLRRLSQAACAGLSDPAGQERASSYRENA